VGIEFDIRTVAIVTYIVFINNKTFRNTAMANKEHQSQLREDRIIE